MQFDIHTILDHFPHRYPFLLLDRVLDLVPGESVVALKNITFNEPCFQGHFPDKPVYPGVLILESMAQTTACLFIQDEGYAFIQNGDKFYYLAGIDNARFKKQVVPGDAMRIESKVKKKSRGIVKFYSQVTVADELVCSSNVMVALR